LTPPLPLRKAADVANAYSIYTRKAVKLWGEGSVILASLALTFINYRLPVSSTGDINTWLLIYFTIVFSPVFYFFKSI
jgi:hypothetical protein